MKRLLQLFLAGVFLISFTAHARVILPKGGEEWSVGSSVQLEWDASGDTVDIQLIRQGEDPVEDEIATGIDNTGHYLWAIPGDLASGAYRIEIVGNKSIESKKFNLVAWEGTASAEALVKDDRAQVTAPLAGVVFTESLGEVNLTWDDVIDWLGDKVRIELRKHSKSVRLSQSKADNSGQFTLPDKYRVTAAKQCATAPGCYFTVRSVRHQERRIASGYFTFGEPDAIDAYAVSLVTETPTQSEALEISWTDNSEAAGPVRVDLYKGDVYYQTIDRSIDSTLGEDNVHTWASIPHTVSAGEDEDDYRIVVTKEGDATVTGKSEPFAITGDGGGKLTVITPEDTWALAKGRTTKKIKWTKPRQIKQVRVDLYKSGRRIKTIIDQSTKKQLRWKVSRFLPTGGDYTLRVQDLDDEATYVFSESFCIQREGETCDGSPAAAQVVQAGGEPAFDPADADQDGIITEQEQLAWDNEIEKLSELLGPEVAQAILAPSGCGDSTIELAGRCVPNDYCPGYDALNDERSLKPGETVSARGEGRVCEKYLVQGENELEVQFAGALEYLNHWLKMPLRTKEVYEGITSWRKPNWFGGESSQNHLGETCFSIHQREQSQRIAKIGTAPLAEFHAKFAEYPLCNHWSSTDYSELALSMGKGIGWMGGESHALRGEIDFLYNASMWLDKFRHHHSKDIDSDADYFSSLLSYYQDNPDLGQGFWWPDQALITDPEVIDMLPQAPAAHAEFIRLTTDYLKAEWRRPTRSEAMELTGLEKKAASLWAQEQPYLVDPADPETDLELVELADPDSQSYNDLFTYAPVVPHNGPGGVETASSDETRPLRCGPGTERRNGVCEACDSGQFSLDGSGCGSCPSGQVADKGRACRTCSAGEYPNAAQNACEAKVCLERQRWNVDTQHCEDPSAKQRDRWVQMTLQSGWPDQILEEEQLKQHEKVEIGIKDYAMLDNKDRDFVYVLGQVTGFTPHKYNKSLSSESGDLFSCLPGSGCSKMTPNYNSDSNYWLDYRQATIRQNTPYEDQDKAKYWTVEDKWTDISPVSLSIHSTATSYNGEVLRGLLQRGVYAAENKDAMFSLNFSGHGVGITAANVGIKDMRDVIAVEMGGNRLDLVTFDSCRMGSYEALVMLEGWTDWVVAHTTNIPVEGWDPNAIGLAGVTGGKGVKLRKYVEQLMDSISTQDDSFESVVAYRMDLLPAFREAFNDLLDALTAELKLDPDDETLEKLKTIKDISENHVSSADGVVQNGWYQVDGFLEAIKERFNSNKEIRRLAKKAEKALMRLTRKKPENDEARLLFGWCDNVFEGDHCRQSQKSVDIYAGTHHKGLSGLYGEASLDALRNFHRAIRNAYW